MADFDAPETSTLVCSVCDEESTANGRRPFTIAGDTVCWQCAVGSVKGEFIAALANEDVWPVRWGGVRIEPEELKGLFSATFLFQWKEKTIEYNTPIDERVNCKHSVLRGEGESTRALEGSNLSGRHPDELKLCNQFLGPRLTRIAKPTICTGCNGKACRGCGEPIKKGAKHECKTVLIKEDPFKGMVRGKEYQKCPKCPLVVKLADGCNAMWCRRDSIYFCYICGSEVEHDGGAHFAPGGCPKWNHPEAPNAQYEQPGEAPMDDDAVIAAWDQLLTILVDEYRQIQELYETLRQFALNSIDRWTTEIITLTRQQEATVYDIYIQEVQRFRNVLNNGDLPASAENFALVGELAARLTKLAPLVSELANNLEAKIWLDPGYEAVDPARLEMLRLAHKAVVRNGQALHAFDATIWTDHTMLWEIYEGYLLWATGRLD
ncbi:hypothetical protein LTR27_012608 [Elasticomyces elasticus]|nr:hypothetical protein LTR27_012608 [Elasticomyces elasticus]